MKLADPDHVAEQYRDSVRFDTRVRIYELYDTSPESWTSWLFARLGLRPGERVLELGCGTGNLWRENAERVPERTRLVLSDLSPGMLAQARERLVGLSPKLEFHLADAQSLPFEDASFDVLLASHMLHHVPDRASALRELRRVLRHGGRAIVGTNHWTHLLELRELLTRFGLEGALLPPSRDPGGFDLENAALEMSRVLEVVGVERRSSALEIRDSEPLVAYVRSMATGASADGAKLEALRRHAEQQIALTGAFHVGIEAGVVQARKP